MSNTMATKVGSLLKNKEGNIIINKAGCVTCICEGIKIIYIIALRQSYCHF